MEGFELPIQYKGKELMLPAQLIQTGYSYKIQVEVNSQNIFFERDDQGDLRALVNSSDLDNSNKTDIELFQAIVKSIDDILK